MACSLEFFMAKFGCGTLTMYCMDLSERSSAEFLMRISPFVELTKKISLAGLVGIAS